MTALRFTQPAELPASIDRPRQTLAESSSRPLKVVLHAIGMAKYRVPVYAEFARRPGIELEVHYTQIPLLQNVEPKGFSAREVTLKILCKKPWLFYQPSRFESVRSRVDQPDVVILPWDLRYVTLVPTIIRARQSGIGVVLWGHGYSKRPSWWRTGLRNLVAKLGDAVMLYHPSALPRLLRSGIDHNRIFIAPNSIDQQPVQEARWKWVSEPGKLDSFKSARNLVHGPVILFVARLMPERRVDVLFNAMALAAEKFPRMQAVLIGGGAEEKNLHNLAVKLRINILDQYGQPESGTVYEKARPSVRFIGPLYEEDDLAPWFLSSDVMCFPAHLGLSVLHAFGYGLPVVTSSNPMAHGPEFASLRDCENGKLFELNDSADLAKALEWVLADPVRHEQLCNAALRSALEDYNVPKMVDGMVQAAKFAATRVAHRRLSTVRT